MMDFMMDYDPRGGTKARSHNRAIRRGSLIAYMCDLFWAVVLNKTVHAVGRRREKRSNASGYRHWMAYARNTEVN
jgi:hypothetical protein